MIRRIDDKYKKIVGNAIISYCLTLMLTFNKTVKIVDFESFLELFKADSIITTVLFLFSFYFLQKNRQNHSSVVMPQVLGHVVLCHQWQVLY